MANTVPAPVIKKQSVELEGRASYYGGKHNGRITSSGAIFNSSQMTAAHPTLPFGTKVIVTNLAKTSVLLQLLQLRKISHAMPFERCRLNDPLVGGMTWTQEIGRRILACTGHEFEGPIAASMTFYAAGRMFRTDWFRSQIQVRDGRIVSLEPSTMPTRRVRAVERKGSSERRREFVQDVTAGVAPEKDKIKPDESYFVTGAGAS